MTKDRFASFAEAIEYYQQESDIRYLTVVERDDVQRRATLRTGEYAPETDAYVTIWPAKNWRGELSPTEVWGEEY